ncbi:beta-defensin 14-like [Nannospalax galili]|uniref:Defensin beta 14 n=1 Tax=Nannospalax galili TaxID=1026970 RepID=A0A8C6QB52_NANGA|nr:beta-defensin 14-like [Nannospalax galili]
MRLHYFLLAFFLLFLVPAPGDGFFMNSIRKAFCKVRGGRCAVLKCLKKEDHIGFCAHKGRKCCRRK